MTKKYKTNNAVKIAVIGGGTGIFSVLTGLKKYNFHLSAIVSMADDGGSSGILREEFGILPPGDIRRSLIALSSHPNEFLAKLFSYRFQEGGSVNGHNFGNLILTALERITGSFESAVKEASVLLGVRGEVIPVTYDKVRLYAELENGKIIKGETNIDIPKHDGSLKISRVWLNPRAQVSSSALKALSEANFILIGPGDLYTSIFPNLVVKGVKAAIQKSGAKKIYICNLMTKFGETHGFFIEDFIDEVNKYLGGGALDTAIVNKSKPAVNLLRRYKKEKALPVLWRAKMLKTYNGVKIVNVPLLRKGNFLRHDSALLAKRLINIVRKQK